MKKRCWIYVSLLAFACACTLPVLATQALAGNASGITYDVATKTLTLESGTYTADDISQVLSPSDDVDYRYEAENIVLNGEITLNITSGRLGATFFSFMSALKHVQTNGTVIGQGVPSGDAILLGCFAGCSSLEEIDLSRWQYPYIDAMFVEETSEIGSLGSLRRIVFSDTLIQSAYVTFATFDENGDVVASLETLQDVTMPSTADFLPGSFDDQGNARGSWFPYDKEGGWNAYQDGVLQASGLNSYEAFRAYQESHPGMTRFVWAGAPQPGPEPDPTPEPEPTPALEDGWEQDDAGWRYVVDGTYVTGWHWIDDTYGAHWYCFSESGNYMITNAWLWDGAWYWVCSSGPMIQGIWQWIDSTWYGFWWNGQMCQGWVWDAGYAAWFYCYENGVMAKNVWVDGYWLNDSGIWA